MYVFGGIALEVHILCGDLPVGFQIAYELVTCQETALSVRNGNGIDVPDLGERKPG